MLKVNKKRNDRPRDELVAVKSDLVLLAPDSEDYSPSARPRLVLTQGGGNTPYQGGLQTTDAVPKARPAVVVVKLLLLLALLYLFVCSLGLLASSFRLLGGRTASAVFQQSSVLSNPVVGLMIGVLVTVLVQSSSTSSSIIVSMVSANFLDVRTAIPIIMGANIGTSVTNTLVSLGQMGNRDEFERAFAGATVHDIFNWLCVIVLLPIEVATGYLYLLSRAVLTAFKFQQTNDMKVELLSKLTKPFTMKIVQLDKKVLEGWTLNDPDFQNATLLRRICKSSIDGNTTELVTCDHLAAHLPADDTTVGVILMIFSLLLLCSCLVAIVKTLGSLLKGSVANVIQKVLNSDLPHVPWLTGYLAILVGAIMTFMLQSSSIFTSSLTPLVGLGLITVDRVYPLTLGSNLGTTTTALLAALSSEGNRLHPAIQVALVHMFFNLTGILIFYVIPFMRIPIPLSKIMGRTTAKYRWFAVFYMILSFGIVPFIIFTISLGGPIVMYSVLIPVAFFILFVVIVNVMQQRRPKFLPSALRSWHWLPLPLRSLQPLDRLITKLACRCCLRTQTPHLYMPPPERCDIDPLDEGGIEVVVKPMNKNKHNFPSDETQT